MAVDWSDPNFIPQYHALGLYVEGQVPRIQGRGMLQAHELRELSFRCAGSGVELQGIACASVVAGTREVLEATD